jgi:hypothetical protein
VVNLKTGSILLIAAIGFGAWYLSKGIGAETSQNIPSGSLVGTDAYLQQATKDKKAAVTAKKGTSSGSSAVTATRYLDVITPAMGLLAKNVPTTGTVGDWFQGSSANLDKYIKDTLTRKA